MKGKTIIIENPSDKLLNTLRELRENQTEKIKAELERRLSHDKTLVDVVKKSAISFSLFCAENCFYQEDGWWNRNYKDESLTTEELYKIWEYEK